MLPNSGQRVSSTQNIESLPGRESDSEHKVPASWLSPTQNLEFRQLVATTERMESSPTQNKRTSFHSSNRSAIWLNLVNGVLPGAKKRFLCSSVDDRYALMR